MCYWVLWKRINNSEAITLLTYRCFIRCKDNARDFWILICFQDRNCRPVLTLGLNSRFLFFSTFLGSRKALEQDAISSSVHRGKVQNTCEIWFSCILIYLKCFSRVLIFNVHKNIIVITSIDTRFSKNAFEAHQKTRSTSARCLNITKQMQTGKY